jgi:hypothetical protein
MKLFLSTAVMVGGLLLTQNSYASSDSPGNVVSVAPKAYSETLLTVLPCGKIVSKRLGDPSKMSELTATNNLSGNNSAR